MALKARSWLDLVRLLSTRHSVRPGQSLRLLGTPVPLQSFWAGVLSLMPILQNFCCYIAERNGFLKSDLEWGDQDNGGDQALEFNGKWSVLSPLRCYFPDNWVFTWKAHLCLPVFPNENSEADGSSLSLPYSQSRQYKRVAVVLFVVLHIDCKAYWTLEVLHGLKIIVIIINYASRNRKYYWWA